MQFCSKSELYQSIRTCTHFGVENAGALDHSAAAGGISRVMSANIDPVQCGDQFNFPCWSTADADVRRALQNELPYDWRALLQLPSFRNIDKQTFFDQPDTAKMSAALVTRRGGDSKDAEDDGRATAAEPAVDFADLFRKKFVPLSSMTATTTTTVPSSTVPSSAMSATSSSLQQSSVSSASGGAPETTMVGGTPASRGKQLSLAPPTASTVPKKHSQLHLALFGEQAVGSDAGGGDGSSGGASGGGGGCDSGSGAGMQPIAIYLPDKSRTRVELKVSPQFTMSRVVKVLLEQEVVKAALQQLPGHDLMAAAYELKLHDEDGFALEMAHNLGDQKVSETGEDEFVLKRRSGAAGNRASGAASTGSPATTVSPTIKARIVCVAPGARQCSTAWSRVCRRKWLVWKRSSTCIVTTTVPCLLRFVPRVVQVLFSDLYNVDTKFKSFASQTGAWTVTPHRHRVVRGKSWCWCWGWSYCPRPRVSRTQGHIGYSAAACPLCLARVATETLVSKTPGSLALCVLSQ
jgi:hypothetical protein